jgi:hypothetical protein
MVRMGVDMLKRPEFGGLKIPIFREMEEALTYIHNELEKGQT